MRQIAVVLATYNPDITSLLRTIYSIVLQKKIDYEIIISDDASYKDFSPVVKKFFADNNFFNYKILRHKYNQGTVKNFLDGVNLTNAKYIRGLGQGDMFIDEEALYRTYILTEQSNADLSISKYVNFILNNNSEEIEIIKKERFPYDIDAYKYPTKLKRNYLVYNDVASGISTCYLRTTLQKYLNEIRGKIKYAEDMLIRLMVYDNCKIVYLPQNMVLYENGSGISQLHTKEWVAKLNHDWEELCKLLKERCLRDSNEKFANILYKRLNVYSRFNNNPNIVNHLLCYLNSPSSLFFSLKKKIKKHYTDIDVPQNNIIEFFNYKFGKINMACLTEKAQCVNASN